MAGGFFDVQIAQDQTAASRAAQAENGARWAVSQHVLETRGSIRARLPEPLMFVSPFLAPPYLSVGAAIKKDFSPESEWLPLTAAGVWQWHRNTKGHYTGAYVYIGAFDVQAESELQHHLTFSGLAYKDLGNQVASDAQMLTSRPVGFGGM